MLKNLDVRVLGSMGVMIAATIGLGTSPAFGQSCPQGTTVSVKPAASAFTASLLPGTKVVFSVGPSAVTCSGSTFQGGVPATGKNAGDPVAMPMTEPECPVCVGPQGQSVTAKTNHTNGQWSIKTTCGGRATVRIPKAGAVARMGGCTMTMAPHGPVDVQATWTNGSPSTLAIDAVVPVAASGTGCPPSTTVTFQATYAISHATDAAKPITVTDVRR
jgi:hypothetical protein